MSQDPAINQVLQAVMELKDEVKQVQENVKEIQDDMKQVQKNVKQVQKEVKLVQEDVKLVQKEVKLVKEDVKQVQNQINDVETRLTKRIDNVEKCLGEKMDKMDTKIDLLNNRVIDTEADVVILKKASHIQ